MLPAAGTAAAPLGFAAYVAANTIEWLALGVLLHASMRLFGGRSTLAKLFYQPLIAQVYASFGGASA